MAKTVPNLESEGDDEDNSESDESIAKPQNSLIEIKLLELLLHLIGNQSTLFKYMDELDFKSQIRITKIINKMRPKQQENKRSRSNTYFTQHENKKLNVRGKNKNDKQFDYKNKVENEENDDFTKLLNIVTKLQIDFGLDDIY